MTDEQFHIRSDPQHATSTLVYTNTRPHCDILAQTYPYSHKSTLSLVHPRCISTIPHPYYSTHTHPQLDKITYIHNIQILTSTSDFHTPKPPHPDRNHLHRYIIHSRASVTTYIHTNTHPYQTLFMRIHTTTIHIHTKTYLHLQTFKLIYIHHPHTCNTPSLIHTHSYTPHTHTSTSLSYPHSDIPTLNHIHIHTRKYS